MGELRFGGRCATEQAQGQLDNRDVVDLGIRADRKHGLLKLWEREYKMRYIAQRVPRDI